MAITINRSSKENFILKRYVIEVVFYWGQSFLVGHSWVFLCSVEGKPFSLGLIDQLFQPGSNQVETFDKALAAIYRDSTENGWKIVLSRSLKLAAVKTLDPNRTRPKNFALLSIQTCPVKY